MVRIGIWPVTEAPYCFWFFSTHLCWKDHYFLILPSILANLGYITPTISRNEIWKMSGNISVAIVTNQLPRATSWRSRHACNTNFTWTNLRRQRHRTVGSHFESVRVWSFLTMKLWLTTSQFALANNAIFISESYMIALRKDSTLFVFDPHYRQDQKHATSAFLVLLRGVHAWD